MRPRSGSALHARGTRRVQGVGDVGQGISPARAGRTSLRYSWPVRTGDQPRTRGEHVCHAFTRDAIWGSAPHAQGAQRAEQHDEHRPGISPARAGSAPCTRRSTTTAGDSPVRAGSTTPARTGSGRPRDQPRAREYWTAAHFLFTGVGSAPHTRGAQRGGLDFDVVGGISPAHSGSTALVVGTIHPASGSAPQVWGATSTRRSSHRVSRDQSRMRGSMVGCGWTRIRSGDQPHARREHLPTSGCAPSRRGSAPHVRAALHHHPQQFHDPRISPARAGSTLTPSPTAGRRRTRSARAERAQAPGPGIRLAIGTSPARTEST